MGEGRAGGCPVSLTHASPLTVPTRSLPCGCLNSHLLSVFGKTYRVRPHVVSTSPVRARSAGGCPALGTGLGAAPSSEVVVPRGDDEPWGQASPGRTCQGRLSAKAWVSASQLRPVLGPQAPMPGHCRASGPGLRGCCEGGCCGPRLAVTAHSNGKLRPQSTNYSESQRAIVESIRLKQISKI